MSDETKKPEKLECVLPLGTKCGGSVSMKTILGTTDVRVPVCEKHFEELEDMLFLYQNGYDPNDMLERSEEWRKKEVLTLKLSGLSTKTTGSDKND